MPMNDSYLFDAGWLFFAAWSVIVAAVGVMAFGPDLFPSRARHEPAPEPRPADSVQPSKRTLL
jgi:hypothetical protein